MDNKEITKRKILDVTCGLRSIWFNKHNPAATFCDNRKETLTDIWKTTGGSSCYTCVVDPDLQCDFTDLPFADETYSLVVFDPPHLTHGGDNSWLVKKYGKLEANWPNMLHDGFKECMRVLKTNGTLIFKWSETQIALSEILRCFDKEALLMQKSSKTSHFCVFFKEE